MLTKQQVKDIFNSVNSCEDLNGINIIDRIKEQLKLQNQNVYEEWEKDGFNIDHMFNLSLLLTTRDGTLLHLAAIDVHVKAINALIARGAKVDAKEAIFELTPLHLAAEYSRMEAINALIDKGAKVDKKNNDGKTPLHLAAEYGRVEAINALIARGAEVNKENHKGYTPLHSAAIHGKVEAINILIDRRADPLLKNSNGKTPGDLVKNNRKLKKFLKEAELFSAVKNGYIREIKELIAEGTNVNAVDSHGKTPLNYAANNKDTRNALISAGNKQAAKKGFATVVTGLGIALIMRVSLMGLVTISQSSIVTAALAVAAAAIIAGGVHMAW